MPELYDLRNDFMSGKLDEKTLPANPYVLFGKWISLAIENEIPDPNAMVLSTCNKDNKPSSRVVLLKYYDENGIIFYTNYKSRKGKELDANPWASVVFYWSVLQKQIRIEGKVSRIDEAESDLYFNKRPLDSKISACISPQSKRIPDRVYLEKKYEQLINKRSKVKRPEFWGGYCLKPVFFEFWQGRSARLHDRIFYEQINQQWKVGRLAP